MLINKPFGAVVLYSIISLPSGIKLIKRQIEARRPLDPKVISDIETRYDEFLKQGLKEWHPPLPRGEPRKRGQKARAKRRTLLKGSFCTKPTYCGFFRMTLCLLTTARQSEISEW